MESGSHDRQGQQRWRFATPLVFLASGGLFMVSALNSEGTDLRPERNVDLASIVSAERRDAEALQARVVSLQAQVQQLTDEVDDPQVEQAVQRVDKRKPVAGLEPVTGAGVTVTLEDSPDEVQQTSTQRAELLVVHQQDIQAVVNAMWLGGAEAITIQGQRVISTTGIKCSGPTVRLHGIPYSQPYVISAVGNQGKLVESILNNPFLQTYRAQSSIPDIRIGWDLELDNQMTAPAYDGIPDLTFARPLDRATGGD